jgi:hypothetical protein
MTNKRSKYVVFKDEEGRYYLLPRQTWEEARVADQRQAEVEAIVSRGADVEGFASSSRGSSVTFVETGTVIWIPSTPEMDDALERIKTQD